MATVTPSAPVRRSSAGKPQSVLVVGAGPGGLAAAMLLARAGLSVTVLEKQPRPGGRTSANEAGGVRFDRGPPIFLYPRVLQRIYRVCGRDLMREVPMTRLDPQYKLLFGGGRGEINCTPDLDRMAAEVAKLCPGDGPNVRRFIEHNRHKLERFRTILERPFSTWRDLLSPDMVRALPLLRPWLSVDGELRRYFADERVRLAFTFQSKYLGMSPFNCPSLFSILSYLEYDFGVWHPAGGCSAVSDHMATVATDLGAEVRLGEPVTELLFDGRRVAGARTEQGEYRADAVVVNADFAQAMSTLVPDRLRRRWTDAKLARKRYSCSTFMLYLGIDGRADDVAHHTIYTAEDYVGNLADIETRRQLTADPSVYVQNASVTDPTLAPKGMSTLYVLAPTPNRTDTLDWDELAPAYRKTVLKQVEKIGVTNVEKRIRFEKQVTPRTWEDEYGVFRGATFNLAHTLRQMLHLRPRNRFDEVPGMYLVGGGTHPGSGLPVIYESARITSRLLLRDFGRDAAWLGEPGAADEGSPFAAPVAT